MDTQALESQARLYLYDLMNEAKEHGFKPDEPWSLKLVTEAEKKQIQREYYPAVASKVYPELILDVFHTVKSKLQQSMSKEEQLIDLRTVLSDGLAYIIAFSPKRLR
ncbi:hypothetical protein [Mucilaginibacter ginsenosidivorans]|uniref:Uncharacterized protein n=1 Tax=Mucilaginibacter ginsenosidivorans TaxID=398053 RepID=A0A5B8V0K7_9SPHI|nr:hypothetical protein [Mucilaginibacter ginsenosidivorans]QEC64076.1 hypothetical protein FRZ54_16335 [Mucilaginibacter ginsenosidivorans]